LPADGITEGVLREAAAVSGKRLEEWQSFRSSFPFLKKLFDA
jgi:hypothetical protein